MIREQIKGYKIFVLCADCVLVISFFQWLWNEIQQENLKFMIK